jgi:hypothetical protein
MLMFFPNICITLEEIRLQEYLHETMHHVSLLNVVTERLALLFSIRAVPDSNLGLNISYPDWGPYNFLSYSR